MTEIREDMLKVKRMMSEVEIILGKREGETKLVNKLIDAENLLTYCMSRLENAVVPPCKVGDTLWVLWSLTKARKKEVYPVEAYALRYDDKRNNMRVCVEGRFKIDKYDGNYYTHYYRGTFPWESVGKTVFLTREEAEEALAERSKEK